MQTLYLKWYYGYRNRWDELLFFGVVDWLFRNYEIDRLYIEVGDVAWMETWCQRHPQLLSAQRRASIVFVAKHLAHKIDKEAMLMVFGWGEVLTDEIGLADDQPADTPSFNEKNSSDQPLTLDSIRQGETKAVRTGKSLFSRLSGVIKSVGASLFPRVGYNYLFRYRWHIRDGRFLLLGWITAPHKPAMFALYSYMLPKAQRIVMREQTSVDVVSRYSKNVELYRDFACDVLDSVTTARPVSWSYCILNIHPKSFTPQIITMIQDIVARYAHCEWYRFAADCACDEHISHEILTKFSFLRVWDWTQHTVEETLGLIAGADYIVASRLHVLLPAQHYDRPLYPLIYASKITKLITMQQSVLFTSYDMLFSLAHNQWDQCLLALRLDTKVKMVVCHGDDESAHPHSPFVNQWLIAKTKDEYHAKVFWLLRQWWDRCQKVSFLVNNHHDIFLPLVTYCQSIGILNGLWVVGSDADREWWYAQFPSVQVNRCEWQTR